MKSLLMNNEQNKCEEIFWYEKLHQNRFEDIVIDALKEKFMLSTRLAVHKYEEICSEVNIFDEKCKTNYGVYSLRKYIVERLKQFEINLIK